MATKLDIREQVDLPLNKQAAIAMDGIHHRLFRSMLTLGVVVLAVAFLANVLVENSVAGACKRGVRSLARQQRALSELAAFTDDPCPAPELARRLEALPADSWIGLALTGWLGLPAGGLDGFRREVGDLLRFDAWYDALAPGHQRLLAGGRRDRDTLFAALAEPAERLRFETAARGIPLRLPAGFSEFMVRRAAVLARLEASAASLAAAREGLAAETAGRPLADWLAVTEPAAAAAALRGRGLELAPERVDDLRQRAVARAAERRLIEALRDPAAAVSWRAAFGKVMEQGTVLSALAEKPAGAAWFQALPGVAADPLLRGEGAATAARRLLDTRAVVAADERLTAAYGTGSGLDPAMFWLLAVSFLVCIAGITNAMLISVIERFREIATMKCLGALNGFIARLFLLEAALLGLVGGLLGVLLGGAIGLARMGAAYGQWVGRFFPWGELGADAGIAALCGLGLATVSALYPAFSAARMLPMEAMRIE